MTTIMKILDDTRLWAEKELCSTFKFKVQPKEGFEDDNYEYKREFPKAYTLYPDLKQKYPSVTIQISESNLGGGVGITQLTLLFAIWNNGTHFYDDADVMNYLENQDGYKDVWNWVDLSLNKILKTEYIGDYIRIRHEDKVKVAPIKESGTIPNYYPVFGASISFNVEHTAQQVQDEFI